MSQEKVFFGWFFLQSWGYGREKTCQQA